MNFVNNKLRLAKILIAISLVFLFSGLILDLNGNRRLYSSNNYYLSNNEPKTIVETTSKDNDDIKGINDKGEEITSSNNSSKTDKNNNLNSISNKPKNEINSDNNTEEIINYSLSNNKIRNEIEKKYSIEIKYGEEALKYKLDNFVFYKTEDEKVVNEALIKLKNDLSLYPDGFFEEMNKSGLPLTVLFVDSFSDVKIDEKITGNFK